FRNCAPAIMARRVITVQKPDDDEKSTGCVKVNSFQREAAVCLKFFRLPTSRTTFLRRDFAWRKPDLAYDYRILNTRLEMTVYPFRLSASPVGSPLNRDQVILASLVNVRPLMQDSRQKWRVHARLPSEESEPERPNLEDTLHEFAQKLEHIGSSLEALTASKKPVPRISSSVRKRTKPDPTSSELSRHDTHRFKEKVEFDQGMLVGQSDVEWNLKLWHNQARVLLDFTGWLLMCQASERWSFILLGYLGRFLQQLHGRSTIECDLSTYSALEPECRRSFRLPFGVMGKVEKFALDEPNQIRLRLPVVLVHGSPPKTNPSAVVRRPTSEPDLHFQHKLDRTINRVLSRVNRQKMVSSITDLENKFKMELNQLDIPLEVGMDVVENELLTSSVLTESDRKKKRKMERGRNSDSFGNSFQSPVELDSDC
ncbi:hypothetical protein CLF_110687, partial [Clonorchis sinensis]